MKRTTTKAPIKAKIARITPARFDAIKATMNLGMHKAHEIRAFFNIGSATHWRISKAASYAAYKQMLLDDRMRQLENAKQKKMIEDSAPKRQSLFNRFFNR